MVRSDKQMIARLDGPAQAQIVADVLQFGCRTAALVNMSSADWMSSGQGRAVLGAVLLSVSRAHSN